VTGRFARLVIFNHGAITEERLRERSKQVQNEIDAVRKARAVSEQLDETLRITPKGATTKDKRMYRRARWAAMRARVEVSNDVRKIHFTEAVKRRPIDEMKHAVDSVQHVQREIEMIERRLNPTSKKQTLRQADRKDAQRQVKALKITRRSIRTSEHAQLVAQGKTLEEVSTGAHVNDSGEACERERVHGLALIEWHSIGRNQAGPRSLPSFRLA
jgi:hypothetical protein